MYDLTHIIKFLFSGSEDYHKLSNEDKEKFFFIVNRRLSRAFPIHAKFFNNKDIDYASAMDIWYYFLRKKRITGIPSWFQWKNPTKKGKSLLKTEEYDYISNLYNIKNEDVDFLLKYYPVEMMDNIKKIRKFKK